MSTDLVSLGGRRPEPSFSRFSRVSPKTQQSLDTQNKAAQIAIATFVGGVAAYGLFRLAKCLRKPIELRKEPEKVNPFLGEKIEEATEEAKKTLSSVLSLIQLSRCLPVKQGEKRAASLALKGRFVPIDPLRRRNYYPPRQAVRKNTGNVLEGVRDINDPRVKEVVDAFLNNSVDPRDCHIRKILQSLFYLPSDLTLQFAELNEACLILDNLVYPL